MCSEAEAAQGAAPLDDLAAACPDLDGCRERMESEGIAPLDVDRLTRVLRAIHGDNLPFPRLIPTTPREYAERIVAMDARLSDEVKP